MTSEQVEPQVEVKETELSKKQLEKQEKQAKAYWNSMITRKEAFEMVQASAQESDQRLQMLLIQNRTLLEMLQLKGIATEEEINEHSKQVIESIFGPAPIPEGGVEYGPQEAPKDEE